LDGLVTVERIKTLRGAFRPFQRAHTPGGNYARLGGTRALNGATIGIIGLGEIGHEIATRAKAFDMRVLYHQRTRAPAAQERELGATHVPLATLLGESDWILPQLPTLPATRDIIGRAELAALKPGACIVNVANAPLINRDALIEALRAKKLGGVALDVHYQEPVPDNDELLTFDNVIMTPRMAGSPRFNGLNDFEQLITGLARALG
jgi:glyoxylate reductase